MGSCGRMLRYRMGAPIVLDVWRNEASSERNGLTDDLRYFFSQRPDWVLYHLSEINGTA